MQARVEAELSEARAEHEAEVQQARLSCASILAGEQEARERLVFIFAQEQRAQDASREQEIRSVLHEEAYKEVERDVRYNPCSSLRRELCRDLQLELRDQLLSELRSGSNGDALSPRFSVYSFTPPSTARTSGKFDAAGESDTIYTQSNTTANEGHTVVASPRCPSMASTAASAPRPVAARPREFAAVPGTRASSAPGTARGHAVASLGAQKDLREAFVDAADQLLPAKRRASVAVVTTAFDASSPEASSAATAAPGAASSGLRDLISFRRTLPEQAALLPRAQPLSHFGQARILERDRAQPQLRLALPHG